MNQEFLFKYGEIEMTAIMKDGVPLLPAKEVCQMLGIKNDRQAIKRLDDDEKGVLTIDTLGGPQKVNHVNEFGLYRLIFTSRKAKAKEFQRWVFHEVLPAIRRKGVYAAIEDQEKTIFGKAMIRTIYGIETDVLENKK